MFRCRPQIDGSAIRATTLILFANILLDAGGMNAAIVRQLLWTNNANVYNGGAILYDLDFVASSWQSPSCDLWEEIRSDDMFWDLTQFKLAMELGARFAARMGDSSRAQLYKSQLVLIAQKLVTLFTL